MLTVQPASGAVLLRAVACWYGLTRREQAVSRLAMEGLSSHTVNDHFKAVHRKAGVSERDELLARLSLRGAAFVTPSSALMAGARVVRR
ncbi:helix-turn-helix transcriptional regulator [Actinomadura kijaniata]|uniref:helix-turn-helix transcriptional regulator n=1 Tax=Actinomadura kijaniata TaxID=46161 RepID=UPI00157D85B3|nr:helix-turn-helix transcriptional regulator [Actinomadura kijaniata]